MVIESKWFSYDTHGELIYTDASDGATGDPPSNPPAGSHAGSNLAEFEADERPMVTQCYNHYEPLNSDRKEIRILSLSAGSGDDPMLCGLINAPAPWRSRNYTALSYCWGDMTETVTIMLLHIRKPPTDDGPGIRVFQPFQITKGLYEALQSIRSKDSMTTIWIDALCINQGSLSERASQVSLMGEIFGQATHVTIYQSPVDPSVSLAVTIIAQIFQALRAIHGENASGMYLTPEQFNFSSQVELNTPDGPLSVNDELQALFRFFSNKWFRRTWVLQEVWMSRGVAIVKVGKEPILLWEEVLLAHYWLLRRQMQISRGDDALKNVSDLPGLWSTMGQIQYLKSPKRNLFRTEDGNIMLRGDNQTDDTTTIDIITDEVRLPLMKLFREGLDFQATDKRDKVFAMAGMAEETAQLETLPQELAPDYRKTTSQVFIDFTKYFIRRTRTLDVLSVVNDTTRTSCSCLCHEPDDDSGLSHPSWALWHFGKAIWARGILNDRASFDVTKSSTIDLELVESSPNPNSLRVSGFRVDGIYAICMMPFKMFPFARCDLGVLNIPQKSFKRSALPGLWTVLLQKTHNDNKWPRQRGSNIPRYPTEVDIIDALIDTMTCKEPTAAIPNENVPAADNAAGHFRHTEATYKNLAAFWAQQDDPRLEKLPAILRGHLLPLHDADETREEEFGSAFEFNNALFPAIGRCLFISKEGHLGLCPPGTVVTDTIVLLDGGKVPFVLREIKDEDGGDKPSQEQQNRDTQSEEKEEEVKEKEVCGDRELTKEGNDLKEIHKDDVEEKNEEKMEKGKQTEGIIGKLVEEDSDEDRREVEVNKGNTKKWEFIGECFLHSMMNSTWYEQQLRDGVEKEIFDLY